MLRCELRRVSGSQSLESRDALFQIGMGKR
jgi:hypothetical protein